MSHDPRAAESTFIGPEISVYLPAHAAVYVEIPKVACSAIKVRLAEVLNIDLTVLGGNPHVCDFPQPPITIAAGPHLYPGLFVFAFVRNPWDRLVSCYRDKIAGQVDDFTHIDSGAGIATCLTRFPGFTSGMSFGDFVREVGAIPDAEADEHFRSQSTFLTTKSDAIGVDFVGRFERLQADFEKVGRHIGLPSNMPLPRLQAAPPGPSYKSFYSNETRRLAADRYAADIDTFGYRFDE